MARNKALDKFLKSVATADKETTPDPEALAAAETAHGDTPNDQMDEGDEAAPSETQPEPVETHEPIEPTTEPVAEPAPAAEPAETAAAPTTEPGAETPAAETARTPSAESAQAQRLRRDRDRLRASLERAQAELEAERARHAQPVAAPTTTVEPPPLKAAEDPEPDPVQFPVEHDEWDRRQLRRELAATRAELSSVKERVDGVTAQTEQQRMVASFDKAISAQRAAFAKERPEIESAREFLRDRLGRQAIRNGLPEEQVEDWIANEERIYLARQADRARRLGEPNIAAFAFEQLIGEAEDRGWMPEAATPQSAAPTKPMTPAARAKDATERVSAARSATRMGAQPVTLPGDDEKMTAERFLAMTPLERAKYKKKHPDIVDELMDDGSDSFSNPLLAGRSLR